MSACSRAVAETACIMTIIFGSFAGYKIRHWDRI
jgi:hypothetical protein